MTEDSSQDRKVKKRRPKGTGPLPVSNFRLEPEVLAKLDGIAEHYSPEAGRELTRTDAIRISTAHTQAAIDGGTAPALESLTPGTEPAGEVPPTTKDEAAKKPAKRPAGKTKGR